MDAIKKIFLGLLVVALLASAAIWYFFRAKSKASDEIGDHIPESHFVARLNTKEALKLAYSLRNDSLASLSHSKWSTLITNTGETGIDLLVDPWIFGDS